MPPLFALINTLPEPGGEKREPQADGHKAPEPAPCVEADSLQAAQARQALGRRRGGLTSKVHLLVEGKGRPLAVHLTAGQVHESTQTEAVLDKVRVPRRGKGRPRKRPHSVLTDKGYNGKRCRQAFRSRRIQALIPTKSNERTARLKKGAEGGRPFLFDKQRYKKRNIVERCINRLKQFRRIATRYDKQADSYQAFITFASILIWLRS